MATRIEESLVSVGQLADLLGCSVRSIYRWERDGVIPKPGRIDRGGVSARVYTEAEVEQIREKMRGRLSFTALVRDVPQRRPRSNPVRKVMTATKQGIFDEIAMDTQFGPLFMNVLKYARNHGGFRAVTLVVETLDGERRTFAEPRK